MYYINPENIVTLINFISDILKFTSMFRDMMCRVIVTGENNTDADKDPVLQGGHHIVVPML